MSLVLNIMDDFERTMLEIKVLEEQGIPKDSDEMADLLTFSNIVMAGMITCYEAGTITPELMVRFQRIVRDYKYGVGQ